MHQPWSLILRSGVIVLTLATIWAASDNRVFGVPLITDEAALPILLVTMALLGLAAAMAIPRWPPPAPERVREDDDPHP